MVLLVTVFAEKYGLGELAVLLEFVRAEIEFVFEVDVCCPVLGTEYKVQHPRVSGRSWVLPRVVPLKIRADLALQRVVVRVPLVVVRVVNDQPIDWWIRREPREELTQQPFAPFCGQRRPEAPVAAESLERK